MERNVALWNASKMWEDAALFGHGSIITLDDFRSFIQLVIHFPYSKYHLQLEKDWLLNRMLDGARIKVTDYPDDKEWVVRVEWDIDQKEG